MSNDVDVTTATGVRITSMEGLSQYNKEQTAKAVAEGRKKRREAPMRAEKAITEAMESDGREYLRSVVRGRSYFFGMGFTPKGGKT